MSSIMTNSAAMTALKSLQATNAALEVTQSRISTGLKVGQAADNAAYWSIATTMRSDNKALSTVQDALGLGTAKVDVAYTGMNSAIDVVAGAHGHYTVLDEAESSVAAEPDTILVIGVCHHGVHRGEVA